MKISRCLLACALVLTPLLSSSGEANDILDFIRSWRNVQEEYERRFDRWDDYRERQPPEPGRVPPPRDRYQEADLRQIGDVAREMQPYVTAVASSVVNVNNQTLRNAAHAADDQIHSLIRAADRGDRRDVQEHHQRFDEEWQKVAFHLQNYQTSSRLDRYLDIIESSDRRLHQLLNVGYRPGFDRTRVSQLAERLDRAMEDLLTSLERSAGSDQDWRNRSIIFQARRAARHADEFAELSRMETRHSVLVSEFNQFDTTWHELVDRTGYLGRKGGDVDSKIASVRSIDRELHQVLLVESPLVPDRGSFDAVLRRAEATADELSRELSRSMWSRNRFEQRQLIGSLMQFRDELDGFQELRESQRSRDRWSSVQSAWERFEEAREEFSREDFTPTAVSLYTDLSSDYELLNRRFDAQGRDWRYRR